VDVQFVELSLPEFDVPTEVPVLPPRIFHERYRRLERAREAAGFDCLAVYADREHSANLAWLTASTPALRKPSGSRG